MYHISTRNTVSFVTHVLLGKGLEIFEASLALKLLFKILIIIFPSREEKQPLVAGFFSYDLSVIFEVLKRT